MNRGHVIPIATLLVLALTYMGFRIWVADLYRGMIPESLEVDQTMLIDGHAGGFLEGCGVAVFRLSAATVERIRTHGIHALQGATKSRKHGDRHSYSEWKETPIGDSIYDEVTNPERSFADHNCADIPDQTNRDIVQAIKHSGSYYATLPHAELLVLPGLALVIYSYNR